MFTMLWNRCSPSNGIRVHDAPEYPHSRPHVSNDNPYSESQFKTLKYRPEFPKRFGSIQHARDVCRDLFGWYNTEHYHSGIGLLTPESVHYGRAATIVEGRKQVLLDFFGAHPERFVKGTPKPPEIPSAAWINPPTTKTTHQMGATSHVRDLGRPTGTPHLHHLRGSRRLRLGPPQ